jgi:hypothetical protein
MLRSLTSSIIAINSLKRDSVTRLFASGFFRESSTPRPLIIAAGSFGIFSTTE